MRKLDEIYVATLIFLSLIAMDRYDEAINHLNNLINFNPTFADAYINLANAYDAKGKLHMALENYKKALVLAPDNRDLKEAVYSLERDLKYKSY